MTAEPTRLALLIDLERCTGCKSCEAACKQSNALGPNAYRNRVVWFDQQQGGGAARLDFLTVTCQQCARPACLRACPVNPKAIVRDPLTGVVAVDAARCTGCGECALACPYGAIGYDAERHHAVKCDLCAERRARDLGPACAAVCPARAIRFGPRDRLLEQAAREGREALDTDHFLQRPATVYLKRPRDAGAAAPAADSRPPALIDDPAPRARIAGDNARGSYRAESRAAAAGEPTRVVAGGCNICFNGCPVKFHLQGNRVVNIFGNEEDPQFQGRICPKSQMTLQMYDNPRRLTRPLKRIGPRGGGRLVEIGWAQALDEIAAKLERVRENHGAEALAIQSGSRTGVLNIVGVIPLFAGLWGTPNTATTEPYCSASRSVALALVQGQGLLANTYTGDDIGSAGAYVYIGDNQAETRPVNFGLVNDWRVKNGTPTFVVDPRLSATASKADHWLPIRSGTDLGLGLGIIHYLFSHDLHDEAFCQRWIVGWREWREFVFARGYDLDWCARVTDLDPAQIELLARSIAGADGCMIFTSRGINQHSNGVQSNRVFMFIAAITGNWGRRGGGYFNVASEVAWGKPFIPEGRRPATRPAAGKSPSDWLSAMTDGEPYPIRALITGNNPLAHWPQQYRTRRALEALDLVVHLELFENMTSAWADYVLPMASGIEKGGTTRFAEDRRIVWNDRLIDPPGEAKSDHWFWIELGKRFGFDDVLKDDYKDPRRLWDEVLVAATPALAGAGSERLAAQPNRTLRLPLFDAAPGGIDPVYVTEAMAADPSAGLAYPTPSGRLEFWTEAQEARFAALGLSALPEFYSEAEQLVDLPCLQRAGERRASPFTAGAALVHPARIVDAPAARDPRFDTELVTGRPPAPQFHSWTHYFWQAQEMWPELYCQIHPDKAAPLGIGDGDRVTIETAHGSIEARAWVRRGIRPSSVFVPIGWDERQPFHPGAGPNHLTGIRLDPISQQANLKTHLCRVTRAV